VEAIITTLGENGSLLATREGESLIPAAKARRVMDPTGAGDAFRSGLIKGLAGGIDLVQAAKLGAVSASFAVEHVGTQAHVFTLEEFWSRYEENFGPRA
jgi:adenosine kinase